MDRVEAGIRTIIAFTDALNRYDVPAMLGLYSEDCVLEAPAPMPDGSVCIGKADISQYWKEFFTRLPEVHLKIEEIFGFGVRCILRWRCDWKDETGDPRHLRGLDLFRLHNGLITENLSYVKG